MVKVIERQQVQQLNRQALASERKRSHYNLHEQLQDPIQRLCIALQPDTYIRPHVHRQAGKWELISILQGAVRLLCFDNAGSVSGVYELNVRNGDLAVELAPDTWHSLVVREADSLILEVKPGPYEPSQADDFAPWSPLDSAGAEVRAFMHWSLQAGVGDVYSFKSFT